MSFSVNTNLGALQAYNALAKVNAETQKAQLRLATMKKINSVADDTSGYNVGKQLEAQSLKQKAQLNNVSSAKNYLSTAESALQQINDKLNQITSKYTDSLDPLKDQASIAQDIDTLANEVKSALQTTKINNSFLLVGGVGGADITADAADKIFDVGGSTFAVDFGSNIGVVALLTKVDGLTIGGANTGAAIVAGNAAARTFVENTVVDNILTEMSGTDYTIQEGITFKAAFMAEYDAKVAGGYGTKVAVSSAYNVALIDGADPDATVANVELTYDAAALASDIDDSYDAYDTAYTAALGGGNNAATVISNAEDLTAVLGNVREALGRIGNLIQSLDSRSDFLTTSVANNTALISSIFDTDMAAEQLNATKGQIASQITTAMLSQMNTSPQNLLSLFK